MGQLVLDDVADEVEGQQHSSVPGEPTDPFTKMLQWGVDNMDRSSIAEQAKAIREVYCLHEDAFSLQRLCFCITASQGRMKPKPFDREAMDILFGSKINYLQNAVNSLLKARNGNDEDEIIFALEQLEEQITGTIHAYFSCSRMVVGFHFTPGRRH